MRQGQFLRPHGRAIAERIPRAPGLISGKQHLEVVDDTDGELCNYSYLVYGLEAGKGH